MTTRSLSVLPLTALFATLAFTGCTSSSNEDETAGQDTDTDASDDTSSTATPTAKLQMLLTDAPADLTHAAKIEVTIDEVRVHVDVADAESDDSDVSTDDSDASSDDTDTSVAASFTGDDTDAPGESDTDSSGDTDSSSDTDAPSDVEEAAAGASGWKTVCASPAVFDLLTLTGGVTSPMCPEATIDAGKLTQIRLVVSAAQITWDDGRDPTALTIPSGEVKIVGLAKALPADGALSLTLDFDAAESIHEAGPNYVMRPTIKVVDN
jgi:hypothetical protein